MAGGTAATPRPSQTTRIMVATEAMQFMCGEALPSALNSCSITAYGSEPRAKLMMGKAASSARLRVSSPMPSLGLPTQAMANSPSDRLAMAPPETGLACSETSS